MSERLNLIEQRLTQLETDLKQLYALVLAMKQQPEPKKPGRPKKAE